MNFKQVEEVDEVVNAPRTTSQISAKSLRSVIRSRAQKQAIRLGADPQDVEDMTQDVFLALFSNDAQILRRWKPSQCLSLSEFVGLLAERQVVKSMRCRESSRLADNDWTYAIQSSQDRSATPEATVASREVLNKLRQRLREHVTERGLRVFDVLMVHQRSVASTSSETGISAGAIYVWRTRLRKLVRSLSRTLESDGRRYPTALSIRHRRRANRTSSLAAPAE